MNHGHNYGFHGSNDGILMVCAGPLWIKRYIVAIWQSSKNINFFASSLSISCALCFAQKLRLESCRLGHFLKRSPISASSISVVESKALTSFPLWPSLSVLCVNRILHNKRSLRQMTGCWTKNKLIGHYDLLLDVNDNAAHLPRIFARPNYKLWKEIEMSAYSPLHK